MKKLSYFVVGLLLLSSFAIIGIGTEAGDRQEVVDLNFLEPNVVEKESYVELSVEGANNYIFSEGKPMLPMHTETLTLPFGAKIKDVDCDVKNIQTMAVSRKVMPSPQPYIKSMVVNTDEPEMDTTIYESEEMFPETWFSYRVSSGLDENMEHKTFVTIESYPVRYSPATDTVEYAEDIDITVTYDDPTSNPFPATAAYDLVIIAPEAFSSDLQPLIDHKNSYGVETYLKTTEDIFSEYNHRDKPEEIKYFIKDTMEDDGVKYVLLVGGLKSLIWANPKEHENYGVKAWHVPVRFTLLDDYEPGLASDLYYADVYDGTGSFDDWDSDGDGKIAEFGFTGDKLDCHPDVGLGRLACRNNNEVKNVVDKIIHYETNAYGSDWFEKMIVISGDGFLDQEDLDIQWDTSGLPNGDYTIYAQSTNNEAVSGPIEEIEITIDRSKATVLTFNHDDHLTTNLQYPHDPVAEIMSASDGDILGNTDFYYSPTEREAYCNSHTGYGKVEFRNDILHIRGKTYDPQPYGVVTDLAVWVKNSAGDTIFSDERIGMEMYFEGEWTTGEQLLHDRAGGPYYMPSNFDREFLWSSIGNWNNQQDVIDAISGGAGFTFFSGHGSPAVWSNHYPGIPGNRHNAEVKGLFVVDVVGGPPFFPMEKLSNDYENPIVVVGGCHNSLFTVTLLTTLLDRDNSKNTHSYGNPTAECWSWWLTRLSKRGAIAAIGNTGYGFGYLSEWCTTGGADNWITTEFFKQYGTEGHDILGEAYAHTISNYVDTYGVGDAGDMQSVQQWVLFGDPSLKIGGYPPQQNEVVIFSNDNENTGPNDMIQFEAHANQQPNSYAWDLDNDGEFDDATGKEITEQWTNPGVHWVSVKAIYDDTEIITHTIVDIEKDKSPNKPTINGPTSIKTNVQYSFTVTASDPYGDELHYIVDWGDDQYSVVTPEDIADGKSITHKWSQQGSYEIKVQTYDSTGQWSDWSDPLTVSLARSRQSARPFMQFLQNFFEIHPNAFPMLQQLLGL